MKSSVIKDAKKMLVEISEEIQTLKNQFLGGEISPSEYFAKRTSKESHYAKLSEILLKKRIGRSSSIRSGEGRE